MGRQNGNADVMFADGLKVAMMVERREADFTFDASHCGDVQKKRRQDQDDHDAHASRGVDTYQVVRAVSSSHTHAALPPRNQETMTTNQLRIKFAVPLLLLAFAPSVLAASFESGTPPVDPPVPAGEPQICCDGGAQNAKCAYEVFSAAGTSISTGELDDGECLTLGPSFAGFATCKCDHA